MRTAWSATQGSRWEDGVVAGTGVVGAVVFGSPSRHVMTLAHERFFVPANSRRAAPHLAPALARVRQALLSGDERAAADAVEQRLVDLGISPGELVWTDPLGAVAQLVWTTPAGVTEDYRREVALDSGDVAVSWRLADGVRTGFTLSTTHGAEHLGLTLWSDVDLVSHLSIGPVTEREPGASTAETTDIPALVSVSVGRGERELVADVVARGLEAGTDRCAQARLVAAEPLAVDEEGWSVHLRAGVRRHFRLEVTTDAPAISHAALDARELLSRSSLSLGGRWTDESVERLWERARHGDDDAERAVIETAYAAGRRNVVASTGALPPTLQGVWQGTWSPAWSADYTLNGNVQLGSLASVLWTGTPELMRSLFRLVVPHAEDYRSNARQIYGVPGMLLPARMTTHGHANHFTRDYPHQFWTGQGGWLVRMAADYIQTTGDLTLLDEWLWTFTTEVLELGLAVLADGGGALVPSYSPENTPAGRDDPLVTDATMDIAILRDALRLGAWFAELRGDECSRSEWLAARETLPGYAVAADGTLAEWSAPWPENMAHRHASQLYGLWYEPDDAFDDPRLADAARATVRAKVAWRAEDPTGPPGRMEMAFGLTSVALAAAALGDADSAYQCALWLARDHFTAGLMSTHDAGAILNVDASGGLPAVVAAMLLSSSPGRLDLLPALPRQWPEGRVTGLRARGGVVVADLRWQPDELQVTAELPADTRWLRPEGTEIRLPWPATLVDGDAVQRGPLALRLDPEATAARFTVRRR